jgi:sulfur carrier protein ThiS
MKILFLNHDGGGFADHIDIDEGMTVATLFEARMKDARPEDYLIRVNRQPCSSEQLLQEGDRVSITPRKIEGAA